MYESDEFLKRVLDAITEHIVVIDRQGYILYVNLSWMAFGQNNSYPPDKDWLGINYLEICDKAGAAGDDFGLQAAKGIRKVITAEQALFYLEYPCHSLKEKRWFMMRVTPFTLKNADYFVISHQNITERKLAEEAALKMSRIDGLTNIPNRRCFDEFLKAEWGRCARFGIPLSLAIIDIDYFKLLNDTYGHQIGDEYLKIIGKTLKKFAKRPDDLCARYGGEEFAIVYGNTGLDESLQLANKLLDCIRKLGIPQYRFGNHVPKPSNRPT